MSFYGWKPYVSVAERRKKAEKAAARARKGGRRSFARGGLSWRYRQDFLGQGMVPTIWSATATLPTACRADAPMCATVR